MKKLCYILILALLLSLGAAAFADNGVEIIYMDGIPVVMESFGFSLSDNDAFDAGEGFKLPAALVTIEEEAFAGIPATSVEITENVQSIGPRAFADCPNLRELPSTAARASPSTARKTAKPSASPTPTASALNSRPGISKPIRSRRRPPL